MHFVQLFLARAAFSPRMAREPSPRQHQPSGEAACCLSALRLFKSLNISPQNRPFLGGWGCVRIVCIHCSRIHLILFPATTSPGVAESISSRQPPIAMALQRQTLPRGMSRWGRSGVAGTNNNGGRPGRRRLAGPPAPHHPPPGFKLGRGGRLGKGGGRLGARCQIVSRSGRAGAGGGAQVSLPAT